MHCEDIPIPVIPITKDHSIAPNAPSNASVEPPPSKPDEVSLKMPSEMGVVPWNIWLF